MSDERVAEAGADPGPVSGESSSGTSPSLAFLREVARAPELRPSVLAAPWRSERFSLREQLGAGGFGTVYEALDHKRGAAVALKWLRRADAHALLLFKQEFRALAGLTHPNLVQLYELFSEGDAWFFTMERIQGQRFTRCVPTPRERTPGFDMERLRGLLWQLADGLDFLHGAGKLHRDIKPSNVMVTDEDRVVLLDFGLVMDITGGPREALAAGTPRYMAPEQAASRSIGPAADWYAVGVMLYEVLTGRLPADTPRGADGRPVPPRVLAPDVPEDLEALCLALLAPEPGQRPTGGEVRERLSNHAGSRVVRPRDEVPLRGGGPFIGREGPLRQLGDALATAREGRTVVALVRGPSGIGKSALVHRFLADPGGEADSRRVVLTGRCFEQESVPYKLLDSLLDALCRHLHAVPGAELDALLPADLASLARLFPVLRQLPPLLREVSRDDEAVEPQEARRRGARALRELLHALARRGELVLFLDDIQWGDPDSAAFLLEVLLPPDAPPLLLVATYRGDELETSRVLAGLLSALRGAAGSGLEVRDIALGALGPEEAERLARTLLGDSGAPVTLVPTLAAEGQGHPFLITELARLSREDAGLLPERSGEAGLSMLDALILARVERLPEPARRLMEVVSLAGQPLPRESAARAAFDSERARELPALAHLRAGNLVRVRWRDGLEELLPYHDRVREAVAARLPAEARRERHLGLALSLEASGHARAEQLLLHFREAGCLEKAARYAVEAATRAHEVLAFERAARLYREALSLGTPGPEETRALTARLGEALASAGRPREAALAWLEAAEGAEPARALPWRHRAMEQLLLGGYTGEGLDVLTRVSEDVGLAPSRTAVGSAVGAVLRELRLRVRGTAFQPRVSGELPVEERLRIDVCWSAALGLSIVDPVAAADFRSRHLELALRSGDAYRASRGLSLHAIMRGMRGDGSHRELERLLRQASELAEQSRQPHARAWAWIGQGMAALHQGAWARAESLMRQAEALLQARCADASWELDFARMQRAHCLWHMGEVARLAETVPALLADVRGRGHRYFDAMVRTSTGILVRLAADAPEEAWALVRSSEAPSSHRGFRLSHEREAMARLRIALYRGEGAVAWELARRRQPMVVRSGLLRMQLLRVELRYIHALAALATPTLDGAAAGRVAFRAARALERESIPWAHALARVLRATLASRGGRREDALRLLADAEAVTAEQGMLQLAAIIRRRRGEALGGAPGQALVEAADREMRERGIQAPERMADLMTPRSQAPR
ncbi:serine/threonine-protein kinase [Myxococcus sp. RHSTA-1-4]|uniref:serine/threonine-protein kinase n=1 Tax=Myxococcus sp. RHSTA-1-4 TaxID=2874601 RepID=UPI001CBCDBBD|nr:serine/threonine-protein kinase [Myxococcus sp. RHSTA-1-4]MBZ4417298.1 protein kinase [Myxococcus sp. RHSTA-1-4]